MTKLASLMTRKRNKMENIHLLGFTLCSDLEKKTYWHQQSSFPVLSSQEVDCTVLNVGDCLRSKILYTGTISLKSKHNQKSRNIQWQPVYSIAYHNNSKEFPIKLGKKQSYQPASCEFHDFQGTFYKNKKKKKQQNVSEIRKSLQYYLCFSQMGNLCSYFECKNHTYS